MLSPPATGNLSVLVVDDDDTLREALSEMIAGELGCTVHVATNGQEAIDVIRRQEDAHPCLILLDWMMPRVSGAEVMQWLRQDESLASIPVAVVSGAADVEAPGAVCIVRKPVALEALVDLVRDHCEKARRRMEAES